MSANETGLPDDTLLTTDEAARFLRLSRPTLERYRLLGTPHLPFVKIGGKRGPVLYRMSDLMAFVERCRRNSTSE